jgi:hypothetical protein
MNAQATVKDLFHSLDFKVPSLQRIKMQQGWDFEQVVSLFSHLWFVVVGHANTKHHGSAFELRVGSSSGPDDPGPVVDFITKAVTR